MTVPLLLQQTSTVLCVCVCVCNYCQFTDDYDKGELNTSLAIIVSLLAIILAYVTSNTALKIVLTQRWEL